MQSQATGAITGEGAWAVIISSYLTVYFCHLVPHILDLQNLICRLYSFPNRSRHLPMWTTKRMCQTASFVRHHLPAARQLTLFLALRRAAEYTTTGVYQNIQSSLQFLTHLYRQAAKHYLASYHHNQKPDNRGYGSYLEAEEAWCFFQKTGIVPLAPIDGGVGASVFKDHSAKAHHHSSPSPSVAQASPANRASSSSGLPARLAFRAAHPVTFYIVLVGYSPGVYNFL